MVYVGNIKLCLPQKITHQEILVFYSLNWCNRFNSKLLFSELFTESSYLCNFADDTTFSAWDKIMNFLMKRLELDSLLEVYWFENYCIKLNQDQCFILTFRHKHENIWA